MERIDEIKREIKWINEQIRIHETRREELESEGIMLKFPFRPGQIVFWEQSGVKLRGRVIRIMPWIGYDSFQMEVRMIRKDGSDGFTRKIRQYNNPTIEATNGDQTVS